MSERPSLRIYGEVKLLSSSLVVSWNPDAGKLGPKVTDYLKRKLGGQEFAEIEPADFFPMNGVPVADNVAQFPESKFYGCPQKDLAIFHSYPPIADWYRFLNLVLDVAEHHCQAKEVYCVGGTVSLWAHTTPREIVATANSPEMKRVLAQYGLARDRNYETPPGQRPTMSSFLLWVAQKRKIPAASLWVRVPFYLSEREDPRAWKKALEFLNARFSLGLDFRDLEAEAVKQGQKIAQLRRRFPEIDQAIGKLESNLGLAREEAEPLTKAVQEFLQRED